jgi:hypothetical protein
MATLDEILGVVVTYIDENWSWLILAVMVFFLVGALLRRFFDRGYYY